MFLLRQLFRVIKVSVLGICIFALTNASHTKYKEYLISNDAKAEITDELILELEDSTIN